MNTEEMRKVIELRVANMNAVRAKIDFIYQRTEDMFKALDGGASKDECFLHWIKLFEEDMSHYSKEDRDYFVAVCGGLVGLVDGFMKYKEDKQ